MVRTFIPGSDEPAMNEVIRKSFNSATANAYPLPPARFVIVAEIDGKIVGHTSVRPMLFHMGAGLVRTANLHMVGTDPAYQHQGVGHAMMDEANEISRREHLAMSILETPVPEFYALKGWEVVGNRTTIMLDRKAIKTAVRDATVTLDIRDGTLDHVDQYVDLRETVAKRCWLFVYSNKEYLKGLITPACQGSLVDFFHEIWQDGRLVGYVFGSRDTSVKEGEPLKIAVRELILETYTPEIVAKIFAYLLEFDEEFTAVSTGFFIVPELAYAMISLGAKVDDPGGNKDMVRVTLVKELVDTMHGDIDQGLAKLAEIISGFQGKDVLLDVDGERVLLGCASGHVQAWEIKEMPEGVPVFSVSRNEFLHVVLGTASPSLLVQEGRAGCNSEAILEQLDAMFPLRPVVINYSNNLFQTHLKEMEIEDESSS